MLLIPTRQEQSLPGLSGQSRASTAHNPTAGKFQLLDAFSFIQRLRFITKSAVAVLNRS